MALSLFDPDDGTMPAVRDMHVGPAPRHEVDAFCRQYHYTKVGGMATWRWGLWHEATLYGVVAYNLPTRSVCESVFGPEHGADHVWTMGRLVLADIAPKNSESRLIGGSLRQIQRTRPDVWGVLTYAATDAGHIGTVYQATNALYTGTGGHAAFYIDAAGNRRSGYLMGAFVSPRRATELGWTHQTGGPKHRYLYVLGSRRQRRDRMALLKYPVLPYPKTSSLEGVA